MNNKNVSANRLREIANEIEGKVKETENYISQIQKDANTVITVCKEMESYDGKGVEGSLNHTTGEMNENGETPWTYSWSIWNIKGASEKKSEVAELNRKVANVKVVLMNLGRLARKMQGSADDISLYQSLIEGLNWKENDPIFSDTFGLLAGHIAWDEYSAAAGNFEGVDPNNIKYWTDKPLRFEKDEKTGAYRISQQDSDGNWVGMGFTDEATALQYMKNFNSKVNKVDSSIDINLARQEQFAKRKFNELSSAAQKLKASGNPLGIAFGGIYAGLQKFANGVSNYLVKNGSVGGSVSNVNTSHMYEGNIKDAMQAYSGELATAEISHTSDNMFMSVNNVNVNGSNYRQTHVVINDPSQISVVAANDDYSGGGETIQSIAARTDGSVVSATGSFFVNGRQNLQGANNLAINNGRLVQTKNGFVTSENYDSALNTRAGGHEICFYKDGSIGYAPEGATAKELIDSGVVSTTANHEARRLDHGQIIQTDQYDKSYDRTYLCMTKPGEYYLIQGKGTPENAVNYAKNELGCTFVGSLEQGGAVGLVANGETIQNHDGYATIADAVVFTDK